MATTQNTFTGNGSNLGPFSFTFKWLESTDIKVTVGGVLKTAGTHYNLQSLNYTTKTGGQVLFTAGNAPANGASIRIYRDTDDEALSAVFSSGSAIRAKDLNDNFTQNLYVTQETNNNSLNVDGSNPMVGDLNMGGYKVINLATPTVSTDASTKGYVDSVIATNAANAAAAAASASAAATSLDTFDDRYLGAKASDPVVDNDGNALITGAMYFNTTANRTKVYNGTIWIETGVPGSLVRWTKTAAGGQTSLSGNDDNSNALNYTPGSEQFFLNGALLTRGVDYTATTGTTITGLVALTAGDVVDVLSLNQYVVGTVPDQSVTNAKVAAGAGIAANKLSFTQAGTGAVARTVDNKLADVVSVKDFGAVGDGVADDTAAIQNALTSSAVSIYFPAGRYKITANLNRSGHTYLYGDGLGASVLEFNGNFSFVYTGGPGGDNYDMKHIALKNLAFECTVKNTEALFDATWTDGIGGTSKSIVIENCEFTGTSNSGGFAHGIRLTNARNVRIDNVRIAGDRDAAPIESVNGLTLVGGNPNGAPAEIFIDALQVFYCQNGISISGWVEGLYVDKSSFIACYRGITTATTPLGRPLLVVTNSHFATSVQGILNTGFVQVKVCQNSFYCLDVDGTATLYSGVQLSASGAKQDSLVSGNDFQAIFDPGSTYGIVISNDTGFLENTVVSDNTINAFDIGVQLDSGTTGVKVLDSNIFYNCGINNLSASGNNIVEFGSYAAGGSTRTFGDGLTCKFGTSVVTTNANGEATITFGTAFPASAYTAIVNNGDSTSQGSVVFSVKTLSTSSIIVALSPNPGVQTIRVNWVVFGS